MADLVSVLWSGADVLRGKMDANEGSIYERMSVSPENLLSMIVDVPSLSEQKKISDFLVCNRVQMEAEGNTTGIKAGACVYEENTTTALALDSARNAVKWAGTDLNDVCYFYSETAEEQFWNRRYIVENFDRALKEGWIKVYYQGISRTVTGKGCAAEALARWIDPVRGILSPGEFIPALERYHLLYKLDLFMAEQVCKDFVLKQERGLLLTPVTVNFSAQDFDYVDVPEPLEATFYRLDSGEKPRPVETAAERDILSREWFNEYEGS